LATCAELGGAVIGGRTVTIPSTIALRRAGICMTEQSLHDIKRHTFVNKEARKRVIDKNLKRLLVHSIEADDVMQGLGVSSKLNADWEFLMHLHQIGRKRADRWLKAHLTSVGIESTVDIREKYL
jgi:NTE family protein